MFNALWVRMCMCVIVSVSINVWVCVDCFITVFDLNMSGSRPPKQLRLLPTRQQCCLHWPRPRPTKLPNSIAFAKNKLNYFPMLDNWFSKVKTIHNIVTVLGISNNNRCTDRSQNRFVPIAAFRLQFGFYFSYFLLQRARRRHRCYRRFV